MEEKEVIIGVFNAHERGFGFVDIGEEEIFISSKLSRNALDGDNVLIKIFENKELYKE